VSYIDDDGYFDDDGTGDNDDDDDVEESASPKKKIRARPKKKKIPQDVQPRFPHPEHLKLPKPIINVGLPKAGTSTIFNFFHCNGLRAQHWYCCDDQLSASHTKHNTNTLMSRCIMENILEGKPLLDGCGDFEVYSEINGPRRLEGFEDPEGNNRNLLDDGTLESRSQSMRHPRILLPQHHYLDRIHEQYPNATFLLNLRPVEQWVESVMNWPSGLKMELPNEFFAQHQQHNGTSQFDERLHPPRVLSELPDVLRYIFDFHSQHVREFVKQHPSHTLIEVDITDDNAGIILADAFGLNETCWGHFNKNNGKGKQRNKGNILAGVAERGKELLKKRWNYRQTWMKMERGGEFDEGREMENFMERRRDRHAVRPGSALDVFKDRRRGRMAGQHMGSDGLAAALQQFKEGGRQPRTAGVRTYRFNSTKTDAQLQHIRKMRKTNLMNKLEMQRNKKVFKEEQDQIKAGRSVFARKRNDRDD
jgi:hypothetical protein